jgi:flagellin
LTSNGYNSDASYDDSELLTSGSATIDGNAISFSGDQNGATPSNLNEFLTISSNSQPLIISVIGSGVFNVTATWDSLGNEDERAFSLGPADITATNKLGKGTEYIEVTKTPATLEDLSLEGTSINSEQNAEAALSQIDAALNTVSESRAFYGAKLNQMTSALNVNAIANENINAARSRITDTDFAAETASLTQSQIVEQASISVRAQAQSSENQVLGLLNGIAEQTA